MRTLILSSETSKPSCRLLRDAIERISGRKWLITDDKTNINVLFRYGNTMTVEGTDGLNPQRFIELSCDKQKFASFGQQNGIDTPYFYRGGSPANYPAIIRTTLTSSGGKGIHVVNSENEFQAKWKKSYWWTPYVQTEFELRLHVLGGQIVKVFKKVREDGLEPETTPIRNNDRGYHFSLREEETYPGATELIAKLHPLLSEQYGAEFYAVDCGWDKVNKRYFVYEINSAPGLNDATAELYANFILSRI